VYGSGQPLACRQYLPCLLRDKLSSQRDSRIGLGIQDDIASLLQASCGTPLVAYKHQHRLQLPAFLKLNLHIGLGIQDDIAGPAASLVWDTTWGSRTLLSARAEREISEISAASRAAAAKAAADKAAKAAGAASTSAAGKKAGKQLAKASLQAKGFGGVGESGEESEGEGEESEGEDVKPSSKKAKQEGRGGVVKSEKVRKEEKQQRKEERVRRETDYVEVGFLELASLPEVICLVSMVGLQRPPAGHDF
jgi:hypothetical protein